MAGCRFRRGIVLPLLSVFAFLVMSLPADATTTELGPLISNWEIANADKGWNVHRDGGASVPLPNMPGYSLWLFGDIFVTDATGEPAFGVWSFWPGTHAAIGANTPGQMPTLSEVPTPGLHGQAGRAITVPNNDRPERFFPEPVGLVNPSTGGPCGAPDSDSAPVSWYGGATPGPQGPMTLYDGTTPVSVADGSRLLFISYLDVCMFDISQGGWNLRGERANMAAYDPARNSIIAQWPVFSTLPSSDPVPWQQSLASPIFRNGYLYTYTSICDSFVPAYAACAISDGSQRPAGRVLQLRVPQSQMHNPASYRWKTATGWTSDYNLATTILPSPAANGLGPLFIQVEDFRSVGEGYLLFEQFSYAAHYRLWQSSSPTGPWTLVQTDQLAACQNVPGQLCYAAEGHPNLSTSSNLVYGVWSGKDGEVEGTAIGGI